MHVVHACTRGHVTGSQKGEGGGEKEIAGHQVFLPRAKHVELCMRGKKGTGDEAVYVCTYVHAPHKMFKKFPIGIPDCMCVCVAVLDVGVALHVGVART